MASRTVNRARAAGSDDKARPMTTSKKTVQAIVTDATAVTAANTTDNPNDRCAENFKTILVKALGDQTPCFGHADPFSPPVQPVELSAESLLRYFPGDRVRFIRLCVINFVAAYQRVTFLIYRDRVRPWPFPSPGLNNDWQGRVWPSSIWCV